MDQKLIENTLLIGNGFSRSVFRNMPSWGDLFEGVSSSIQNYTISLFRLNTRLMSLKEKAASINTEVLTLATLYFISLKCVSWCVFLATSSSTVVLPIEIMIL